MVLAQQETSMNFYTVQGQATSFISGCLSRIGFGNIQKISTESDKFILDMKDGTTSILRFIPSGTSGVFWSVADFEGRAKDRFEYLNKRQPLIARLEDWTKMYDEAKFQEALDMMIHRHDANIGITWETIDFWLDEMCKIE